MTNIELVKKWLEDNDSVSHVELVANSKAAAAAYAAAVSDAADDAASDASYWVERYEELTK